MWQPDRNIDGDEIAKVRFGVSRFRHFERNGGAFLQIKSKVTMDILVTVAHQNGRIVKEQSMLERLITVQTQNFANSPADSRGRVAQAVMISYEVVDDNLIGRELPFV